MAWSWSLNWGEIVPHIVIGSGPMSNGDLKTIQEGADVTALLSIQHDDCLAYWKLDYSDMCKAGEKLGLVMKRSPIRDFDIEDMRKNLPAAVMALAALREEGHRVYVHCTAGMGRAPLTVLGYLSLVERMDPEEAIRLILDGRPIAVPSWEAYRGARANLVARYHQDIADRAHELYLENATGHADADWLQAESEVLSLSLIQPRCSGPS